MMQKNERGHIGLRSVASAYVPARPGFTLVELMIGLLITSFIGAALTSFMLAVSRSWTADVAGQSLNIVSNATANRLQRAFAGSRYVGSFRAGSVTNGAVPQARVFYWKRDDWLGTSDGVVQIGEMALIEYDRTTKLVRLYQAMPYASMNTAQKTAAGGTMTFAEMSLSTSPDAFKVLSFVTSTVLGRGILGAKFDVRSAASTTELPSLDFTLKFEVGDRQETEFGTATMRSPSTQPI